MCKRAEGGAIVVLEHATLPRVFAFQADKLGGLPTAGIRLVQSYYPGNTPSSNFLKQLVERWEMAVGQGIRTYRHDGAYWLGSAAQEASDFAVFQRLYERRRYPRRVL